MKPLKKFEKKNHYTAYGEKVSGPHARCPDIENYVEEA